MLKSNRSTILLSLALIVLAICSLFDEVIDLTPRDRLSGDLH